MILPVESLEITVLVDNGTDSLSTNPGFVETEMAGAWRRGMKWPSGRCLCCAAHGLSCLITTQTPSSQHTLLFDTGPDESIFERNVIRLGVDMGGVDAMMLSHGHWDHAGAMPRACAKLGIAFWHYLGSRLVVSNLPNVPQLPDLVRQRCASG
jgi:7,8-dihydropterin-6-yl-methyl-4-(beta-D-ribofuranosyl)aminobenzene 5'-phosphate synthase